MNFNQYFEQKHLDSENIISSTINDVIYVNETKISHSFIRWEVSLFSDFQNFAVS